MSVSLSPTLLPSLLSLLFVSFLSFSPAPFCALPPPNALTSLFHHFLFHGFISPPSPHLLLPPSLSLSPSPFLLFPSLYFPLLSGTPTPAPHPLHLPPRRGLAQEAARPGRRDRARVWGTFGAPSAGRAAFLPPARRPGLRRPNNGHFVPRAHRQPPASGEWRQAGPCSWRVGKKASGPDRSGSTPLPPLSLRERPRARGPRCSAPGKSAVCRSGGPSPPPLPRSRRVGSPSPSRGGGEGVRGQFSLQNGLRSFRQSLETEGPCF